MSMTIVQHVWQKSQTRNSARTLVLTLAIHANDCCGVAWPADATLRQEVNVSHQRIHELKNAVEATGELRIVERPGTTNLYFIARHGQPLGPQGEYQTTKRGQHQPGCPLRDPALRHRCAQRLSLAPDDVPEGVSEYSDPPAEDGHDAGEEGSDCSAPGSEMSQGGAQKNLTQKTTENERENSRAPAAPVFSAGPQEQAIPHPDPAPWLMHNAVYGTHLVCGALHQPGTPCPVRRPAVSPPETTASRAPGRAIGPR